MSKGKLLLRQISLNLFLVLIIIQPNLAATLKYDPPTQGMPSDRTDGGSRNHPPFPTTLQYDPPMRGAPGDRGDAGSRSPYDISAISPATNLGLTAAEYPTFWLYVPTRISSRLSIQLILRNENKQVIYRTTFEITQGKGIVNFRLPKTAPPLEIGRKYQWVFRSEDLTRYGWVERVALKPEIVSQLATATPRQRVLIFAQNGIWYETLTELAELRRTHPQDAEIAADWAALLQHRLVRLDKIVAEPFLPCCTPEE
ncbi:DUF928 domain-containing protein [Microseira sp. BLCC-F43]|jgi:hypothetical protein|uniref:DUF928 domain-containing protein n=1 Tax=Microseira sp. BLCC-F43 TaxID=3153602 RepID=UPI0035B784DE